MMAPALHPKVDYWYVCATLEVQHAYVLEEGGVRGGGGGLIRVLYAFGRNIMVPCTVHPLQDEGGAGGGEVHRRNARILSTQVLPLLNL